MNAGASAVSGASVQLFAVGTAGNGSQATSLLASAQITDGNGQFGLAGQYTCTSDNEQVYLMAQGGNPGLHNGVYNPSIVLMTALGNCGDLLSGPTSFIEVNEITTVAAVYALAPFMTAFDHVGASATNTLGMLNAFLNAQLLALPSSGQPAALAQNLSVEQGKLLALADALASCSTTDGTGCQALFAAATPSGGTAPADTLTAALNIVKNPGNNVAAVFAAMGSTPPYATSLTAAPHDWTMSLKMTGGGLYEPTALAVDQFGDLWVTNYGGPAAVGGGSNPIGVVAYSPQGTAFAGTPFASTAQTEAYGLAIDIHGDVWVTSEENLGHNNTSGSVAKIQGAEAGSPGTLLGQFYDDSLYFPQSIAADTSNNTILIGNYANGTATVYDLNGNFLRNVGAGYSTFPVSIASDGAGGLWLANHNVGNITHVGADGTAQNVECCDIAASLALDPQGNVWVANSGTGNASQYTFSEVSPGGAVLLNQQSAGGIYTPSNSTIDAGGQFWICNYYDGSFTEIAGNNSVVPAGTGLSPFGYGKDAKMVEPFGIAADPSGNLWVSDRAGNAVMMFFGLATPTATPAAPFPKAP